MSRRVLIIDDDEHLLSALRRQFQGVFDVTAAGGGEEAVRLAAAAVEQGLPFAVAVCDMRMPGLDGIQTLRAVREASPDTSRIMLTGDADQETAIAAINDGAIFRFYAKPCLAASLRDGVEAGLRQHALATAERRLLENEERWRLALAAAGDGAWDWNPATDRIICSDGWAAMLGQTNGSGPATKAEWWARLHPDDVAHCTEDWDRLARGEIAALAIEHRLRQDDGGYRWFFTRGVVFSRSGDGEPVRAVGTCTDITRRKQLEEAQASYAEELRRLATTDPLTGLGNRRSFLEKAEAELARAKRYGRAMSVVMIDIDFFKRINDSHGHDAGDAVLVRLAEILGACSRRTDFIGRLGGEEFAIALPETDSTKAAQAAENLRAAVAAASFGLPNGGTLSVTASFGVAMAGPADESVATILRRADEALYQAKNGGRNRVVCRFGVGE